MESQGRSFFFVDRGVLLWLVFEDWMPHKGPAPTYKLSSKQVLAIGRLVFNGLIIGEKTRNQVENDLYNYYIMCR